MIKVTIEPPKERLVTITMGETDAQILKDALNDHSTCQWDGSYGGYIKELYQSLLVVLAGDDQ